MAKQPPKKPVINPYETLDKKPSASSEMLTSPTSSIFKEIPKVGDNATKLDLDKLTSSYAQQDADTIKQLQANISPEQKNESFKRQFFKKYKQEEEDYYLKRKKEEEEKKQQEELEEQQRKKQEEEQRLAQNTQGAEPKGKVKKNIFGKSKQIANTVLPAEIKPGKGKG